VRARPGEAGGWSPPGGAGGEAGDGFGGYGVEPDTVLDGPRDLGLATRYVGRRVHYFSTVGSTSTALKVLAEEGAAPGTVVLADEQTHGRGRSGRTWHSPCCGGVWMSVLFECDLPAERLAPLSVASAVATAEALGEMAGLDVRVKWPNDLLVGGRKLGGLLVEAAQTSGGSVQSAVLGVGLNVDLAESDLPEELRGAATSLAAETGHPVSRLDVLRTVLPALETCYENFQRDGVDGFRERWRGLSSTLSCEVTVAPGTGDAPDVTGTVVDLSEIGALVVEETSGGRREIWFGDVKLRATESRGCDDD
jgi:BirA family biotin operon repressor/biotin-[acetyl-CoA-carboxylase] ligase